MMVMMISMGPLSINVLQPVILLTLYVSFAHCFSGHQRRTSQLQSLDIHVLRDFSPWFLLIVNRNSREKTQTYSCMSSGSSYSMRPM